MRYIDVVRTVVRNAQEKDIPALSWDEQRHHINAIRQKIDDIEIVVRCKDCNYYDESLEVCRCLQWDLSRIEYPMVGADDFCSYGERKGAEDNNA